MDRIERTQEKFKEFFGGEPTKNEGTDPEFMRILQRFIFGEVCYVGSHDNRMRELITITAMDKKITPVIQLRREAIATKSKTGGVQ